MQRLLPPWKKPPAFLKYLSRITRPPLPLRLSCAGVTAPLSVRQRRNTTNRCAPLQNSTGAVLWCGPPPLKHSPSSTKDCVAEGVTNLLIDPAPQTLGDFVTRSTAIRQLAITRTVPDLGYPVYLDATAFDDEDAAIALGIVKYASVIVTSPLSPASAKAALTLRQNIYTDPQKPIQMNPGLYRVGTPGKDAPVLMTVNFSLTYFTLQGYLESSRVPCFMLIVDTEGLSVLTSVAAGKLNETLVRDAIKKFGVENEVTHRKLIIPGYSAPLSGRIEEATGWKVLVGPRDAAEIGEFLHQEWKS